MTTAVVTTEAPLEQDPHAWHRPAVAGAPHGSAVPSAAPVPACSCGGMPRWRSCRCCSW